MPTPTEVTSAPVRSMAGILSLVQLHLAHGSGF